MVSLLLLFSSLIFGFLKFSCQSQFQSSESRNIPQFHCWIASKAPWSMWDSLKTYWNGTQMMWLKSKINTFNFNQIKSNQKYESNQLRNGESNQVKNSEPNQIGNYESSQVEKVSWIKSKSGLQNNLDTENRIESEPATSVKLLMPMKGLALDKWCGNRWVLDAKACSRRLQWRHICRYCRHRCIAVPFTCRIPCNRDVERVPRGVIHISGLVGEGVKVVWYNGYTVWSSVKIEYSYVWLHGQTLLLKSLIHLSLLLC